MLWILQIAYAWFAVGLGLLAFALWGWVPLSAGIHGVAVGATGCLIMGMITRTARGHTGRMIQASKQEVTAFGLLVCASFARVVWPLVAPQQMTVVSAPARPQGVGRGNGGYHPPATAPVAAVVVIP